MVVVSMKNARIRGMKKDRRAVLDFLQRQGVLEISAGMEDDAIFQKKDALSDKTEQEREAALAQQALEVLNQYAPEEKGRLASFAGREILSVEQYDEMRGRDAETREVIQKILNLSKEMGELRGRLPKLEQQREELVPWSALDIPLDFEGTQNTRAFIGSFPEQLSPESLAQALAEQTEAPVEISLVSSSKIQSCYFLLCGVQDAPAVEETLKAMGLQKAPPSPVTPAQRSRELTEETERVQVEMRQREKELADLASWRKFIKFDQDDHRL